MRNVWTMAAVLVLAGAVCGGEGAVKVGDPAPSVELKDDAGNAVNIASFKDKNGVVVFFYPKAMTPGCTKESCNFRDEIAEYQKKGYLVFGASGDSVELQAEFKKKESLNYPLLSDPEFKLAAGFGFKPRARNTAVIGKDGKIEQLILDVKAATHGTDVLKLLK